MLCWWLTSSSTSARSLPDLLVHIKVTLPPPGPHVVLDRSLGWHLLDGDLGRGGGGLLWDGPVLPGDRRHVGHQVTPLSSRPHLVRLGLTEPGNNTMWVTGWIMIRQSAPGSIKKLDNFLNMSYRKFCVYLLHISIYFSFYLLCLILSISASCLRISCSSSDSLWTGISTMPMLVITCYYFSAKRLHFSSVWSRLNSCLARPHFVSRAELFVGGWLGRDDDGWKGLEIVRSGRPLVVTRDGEISTLGVGGVRDWQQTTN